LTNTDTTNISNCSSTNGSDSNPSDLNPYLIYDMGNSNHVIQLSIAGLNGDTPNQQNLRIYIGSLNTVANVPSNEWCFDNSTNGLNIIIFSNLTEVKSCANF